MGTVVGVGGAIVLTAMVITACGPAPRKAAEATNPKPSDAGEKWTAVSNSAIPVTGDIFLSRNSLRAASATIPIRLVKEVSFPTEYDGTRNAEIYAVEPPSNPHLLHGNTLCTTPVRWIAVWHPSPTGLHFAAYATPAMPLKEDAGACGDFEYSIDPNTIALAKSVAESGALAVAPSPGQQTSRELPESPGAGTDHGQDWTAADNATMSITGDIRLSSTSIRAASKVIPTTVHSAMIIQAPEGNSIEGTLYSLEPPSDLALLNGNKLCAGPTRWVLAWSPNPNELNLSSFSGIAPPARDGDESAGYCGSFRYLRKP